MADLKPLGSEKLNGDDKLRRILELTYYGSDAKSTTSNQSSTLKTEYLSESVNGFRYGIVKEKDGYYVKKGLNESSLDYIGGLFMKNKNKFNSYAEALKRLQLLSGGELNEATKYVLKQKPTAEPANEAPVPSPDMGDLPTVPPMAPEGDVPPAPEGDMGDVPPAPEGDVPPAPEGDMGDEGTDGAKPSDYMSEVQKYSGKLGQELRDQKEKMESDDIKYVLNMIISAVDLDKLDDEDIEEIGKKFDREVDDDAKMSDDMPDVPADDDTTPAEPTGDEDLDEMHAMDKLESFINTPMSTEEEIDLRKYADLGGDDLKEIDLDEIKNEINKSISETLGKYFK
jgi:hypothetical protein